MLRVEKVISFAVEDHVAMVNIIYPQPEFLLPADGLGEAECQEADKCADEYYDAQQPHLLAPCSSLRRGWFPKTLKHNIWAPEGHNRAVHIPQAWGSDSIKLPLSSLFLF